MAFVKAEPKNEKEKKTLARSILSDREEPEGKPEEKHNVTVKCPACGAELSLEPAEDAKEEHAKEGEKED